MTSRDVSVRRFIEFQMIRRHPCKVEISAELEHLHIVDIARVHIHARRSNCHNDIFGGLGRVEMNGGRRRLPSFDASSTSASSGMCS
jgi:hypothetical protein